ncbi:MAG: hypothetical protein, partial [Olavius algarvensis Gamma 1 endosymbiont]
RRKENSSVCSPGSEVFLDNQARYHLNPASEVLIRVSPCSGCETGHPSPPFALRSGDNLYVPRTP